MTACEVRTQLNPAPFCRSFRKGAPCLPLFVLVRIPHTSSAFSARGTGVLKTTELDPILSCLQQLYLCDCVWVPCLRVPVNKHCPAVTISRLRICPPYDHDLYGREGYLPRYLVWIPFLRERENSYTCIIMDIDYSRRNKKPRLLLEPERQKLDEFIDAIHYSSRYVRACPCFCVYARGCFYATLKTRTQERKKKHLLSNTISIDIQIANSNTAMSSSPKICLKRYPPTISTPPRGH